MKYRAKFKPMGRQQPETGIERDELGQAIDDANLAKMRYAQWVHIETNSEGEDHPDNKGKWFLHQIIK